MLEETETREDDRPGVTCGPRSLVAALARLRLSPMLVASGVGPAAGGAAIGLPVRELLTDPRRLAQAARQVRRLLQVGLPVTAALVDTGRRAERRVERVLAELDSATRSACVSRDALTLAVAADDYPLPAFALLSRAWLGDGRRYAVLGDGGLGREGLLSFLYQQRGRTRALLPALGAAARTRCPLLSDEAGSAPLGPAAIMAPPGSAWLPVALDLGRFERRDGSLDAVVLRASLREGLGLADRLFDCLHWPDPEQCRDARENRRIVFLLRGIGDLVHRRGADPAAIDTLRALDRLVAGIHATLWEASTEIATRRGLLPALAERDPSRALADGRKRRDWQRRWRAALATSAVRHRNLLAISPYSLMPRRAKLDAAWLDLLPLLAHADVIAFEGRRLFPDWSISEFTSFHRRTAAVLHRRNAAAFVATGV